MEVKELKNRIEEEMNIPGFKPVTQGGSVCFLKKENECKYKISIGYVPMRNSKVIYLTGGILYYKYFHEVEHLLKKYYKKYQLKYNCYTIYSYSGIKGLEKIPLSNMKDLNRKIPFLKRQIDEKVLPFFETYQTLEKVYEKVESLELRELGNFLYSPAPIRRMIIKKLVKAPDFEEYGKRILTSVMKKGTLEKRGQFRNYSQFLPELYEELKRM